VIEGPLETQAIMDLQRMRFPQDQRDEVLRLAQVQRDEELRLAQDQREDLREFWRSTKQTLKPIAESVNVVLLPYQLDKRALSAQDCNQNLISVLDNYLPPDKRLKFCVHYYMRKAEGELYKFAQKIVNEEYNGESEEAEAEIEPIMEVVECIAETKASVRDLESDCMKRLAEIDVTIQRVENSILPSELHTAMLLFTPMSKPTRKNRFIV